MLKDIVLILVPPICKLSVLTVPLDYDHASRICQ